MIRASRSPTATSGPSVASPPRMMMPSVWVSAQSTLITLSVIRNSPVTSPFSSSAVMFSVWVPSPEWTPPTSSTSSPFARVVGPSSAAPDAVVDGSDMVVDESLSVPHALSSRMVVAAVATAAYLIFICPLPRLSRSLISSSFYSRPTVSAISRLSGVPGIRRDREVQPETELVVLRLHVHRLDDVVSLGQLRLPRSRFLDEEDGDRRPLDVHHPFLSREAVHPRRRAVFPDELSVRTLEPGHGDSGLSAMRDEPPRSAPHDDVYVTRARTVSVVHEAHRLIGELGEWARVPRVNARRVSRASRPAGDMCIVRS